MLRSMTGFGRCFVEDSDWTQTWEIKSINSRYLDLKWRLPIMARSLEQKFEKIVRQYASRGRVELNLTIQQIKTNCTLFSFNEPQALAMLNAIAELAKVRGDTFLPNYTQLITISSLWEKTEDEHDSNLENRLEEGLITALDDWNESRESEGSILYNDLSLRITKLKEWLSQIENYAPYIKEERFLQLKERLSEFLEKSGGMLEESRFLQELVIYADKLDVTEELTRLSSHLNRLYEILGKGSDVGRRLDFTLQECFREISTCGNKIQDIQVSKIVVEFKNELEKCREQVQNLE